MPQLGRIEVLAGPMFSGKTEELLRRIRRAEIAKQAVQVFKPIIDTRYSSDSVVSHSKAKSPATLFDPARPAEILEKVNPGTKVVGIDEVQWCDPSVVAVCETLAAKGVRVIIAGLDMDSQRRIWGPIPTLMAIAEDVVKLSAICTECGEPAHWTQRLISDTTRVVVGGAEMFAARCRLHHTVLPETTIETDV